MQLWSRGWGRWLILLIWTVAPLASHADDTKTPRMVRGHRADTSERALQISGTARIRGVPSPLTITYGDGGRFRMEFSGEAARVAVFDGETLWRVEKGAGPYQVDLFEKEMLLLMNWIISQYWEEPTAPVDRTRDVDSAFTELQIKNGLLAAKLFLDPDGNPSRLDVAYSLESRASITFRDRVDGNRMWIPRHVQFSDMGPEWQGYEFDSVKVVDASTTRGFDRPAPAARDYRFVETESADLKIKQIASGHFLVRPEINGQDVGWWIFDTGAATTSLTKELADKLKLSEFGGAITGGLGGTTGVRRLRKADTFRLGRLEIANLNLIVSGANMEMMSSIAGVPVVGIVGWDVLLRSVVRVDFEKPGLQILDPATNEIPELQAQELFLHWKVPYVKARFEGDREGMFLFDTGAGKESIFFHNSAVIRLGLLGGRKTQSNEAHGAGGSVSIEQGEIGWFEVGGHRTERPRAEFSTMDDGEGDIYSYGFFGGSVTKPFIIVLDYSRNRIGFLLREAPS